MNIRRPGPWTVLTLSLLVLHAAPGYAVGELPQSFTMDGKLFADNAGTAPLSDTGVLKIQILDPAQTCVLYEETQPFDVTQSEGFFHATIGSPPGAPKRNGTGGLDSNNSMAVIYSNVNPTGIAGRSLAGGGCSFVPANGDSRYLRVTVTTDRDRQSRTLSPNLALDSVPAAVVAERAETLRGLAPSAFLQLDTQGNPNLTQGNVESVFAALPALQALLGGTSASYMQSGTGTGADLPRPTTPPTNASAGASEGQIWYDSASHSIRYSDGSAVQTIGAVGSGINSLAIGNGLQSTAGSNITTGGQTISIDSGTGANKIVQLDASGRYPAVDGSQIQNLNASGLTSGTIGNGVVVNTTGAITTTAYVSAPEVRVSSVKIFNGANYVEQLAPASLNANYALTWPLALPGAGTNQVLTADSAGQLTWVDLNSGLVSNQAALPSGQIWIGDAGGKAQGRTPSGDVSLSNAGAFRVNAIQNVGVSATAPTTTGQTLRYDLTSNSYVPAFVAMTDLRSKATGTAAFGASCSSSQTLTYDAVTDSMSCQNITVGAGQLGAGAVATANIADDAVTSAKLNSAGIAVNRLVITDATTGTTLTYATCATNEILKYGATGWTCASVTSLSPVTSVAGKTGAVTLNAADVGGLGTAALLDHGTAAGEALRLDGSARVPAVDGSLLTQVNAIRLQTRDVASTAPAADQVLTWNNAAAAWEPRAVPSAPVQSVAGRTGSVVIYPDDVVSAAGKYLTYSPNNVACANNQTLKWDGTRWICANDENAGGDVTSVTAGAALVGGGLSGDVTLSVDVGTTANKIVQLNASAQLPAVDGSKLTAVNAVKLQTRAIASVAPTPNQILKWNDAQSNWAPADDEDNGITSLTGDVTAAGPGPAAATIAHNAITSVKINDVGVAVNRLLITDPTTGATIKYADTCAVGQVLKWTLSGWTCDADVGSNGIVTNVGAGVGLLGGPITSTGTLRVDVGTGATQIVQLNGSAQIPAVDGSLLTAVNAVKIQSRAISATAPTAGTVLGWNTSANQWEPIVAATGSVQNVSGGLGILGGPITTNGTLSVDVGTSANKIVQLNASAQLPAVDGSLLTSVNAVKLQTRTVANVAPTAGTVLGWNVSASQWEPTFASTGSVQNVYGGVGILGGPITTNGTLSVDVGTAANKIVQLNGSAQLPALDGSLLMQINAVALQTRAVSNVAPTSGQVLAWNSSTNAWTPYSDLGGSVTNVAGGVGILGGPITTNGTLSVDVGTAANKIVQLNGSAQLPAVDGSLLTQINAVKLQTRTVANTAPTLGTVLGWNVSANQWEPTLASTGSVQNVAGGVGILGGQITTNGTLSVDVGTAANKIIQLNASAQIPALDGSLLTQINAVKLQTRAVSNTAPTAGQVLAWNATFTAWTPYSDLGGSVVSVAGGMGILGGPITSNGTLSVDVGTAANKIVQLNGSAQIPAVDGSLLTQVNAVKLQTRAVAATAPTTGQVLGWNTSSTQWEPVSAATGSVTNVAGGVGILGGPITTNGTLSVDVGTTANKILQLNASALIPAVDGSLLMQINAVKLQTRAVSVTAPTAGQVLAWNTTFTAWTPYSDLGGSVVSVAGGTGILGGPITSNGTLSVDVGTAANKIVQLNASAQLPAIDGSLLNQVNAVKLQTRTVSAATPVAGQVLGFNSTLTQWEPTTASTGSVTNVAAGLGLLGGPITTNGTLTVDVGSAAGKIVQENANAQIAQTLGTAALPAYAFVGNLNTGFYSPGTNQVALSNNGTASLVINATGAVGIGTATPAAALHVQGTSLLVGGATATTNNAFVYNGSISNGYVGIYDSSNAVVFGISRQLPAPAGTSTIGGYYKGLAVGGSTANAGNPIFGVLNSAQSGNGIGSTALTVLDNNKIFTFHGVLNDGAGNMGIGTATPQAALDVFAVGTGRSAILIPRDTTANRPSAPVNGMLRYNNTVNVMEGYVNGAWSTLSTGTTSGTVTNVAGGVGILGGPITSNGTLSVDVGSTANKIVQLNASAQLPAVDGSLLTQINAVQLQTRAVASTAPTAGQVLGFNVTTTQWEPTTAALGSVTNVAGGLGILGGPITTNGTLSVDVGVTANKILQLNASAQVPAVDGSLLTQINAVRLQTRAVSAATPTAGQVLGFNVTSTQWEPVTAAVGSVTNVAVGTGLLGGPITTNGTLSVDVGAAANKIVQENANAQIAQGLGSATLPSYTFTGNPNTGVYSPGTNQVALTANGSAALTVTAAGNVAIGTSAASYPLVVSTTSPTPLALIQRTASQNANMLVTNQTYSSYVGLSPTGNFAVGPNNNLDTSPQFAITSAGNVAIGSTTAGAVLDVVGLGTVRSAIIVPRDTTANRPTTPVNGMIRYNSSLAAMETYAAGSWQTFATAASTTGYLPLGGGTMTGALLSANGAVGAPGVAFANDTSTGLYSTGAGNLSLATAGTARLTITPTGLLGINTAAPAFALDVNGVSYHRDLSTFAPANTTGVSVAVSPSALTSGTALALTVPNTGFTGTVLDSTYSSTGSGKNTVLTTSNAAASGDVLTVTNAGTGLTAKFTGGTGNVVIDNGGELGIGTLNPAAILDVTAAGANSAILIPRATTANRPTGVNGMLRYNTSTNANESYVNGAWQNIATGNLYLPLTGGTLTGPVLAAPGTVAAPGLAFSNSTSTGMSSTGAGNLTLSSVGTARLSINQSGVGFGNANPQYPLDVTGNVFMGSGYFTNIPVAPLNLVNSAGGIMKTQLNLINTAGGAGAGSAIDFFTFDIAGGTNPGLRLSGIDTNFTADFAVSMKVAGSANSALVERMRLTAAGRLGIGTNNPGYPLHVVGDVSTTTQYRVGATIVCTSAGCTSSSDSRLKQNVRPLESALDKVLSLNGVTWDWIDKAKYGEGDQVGVIAQDLERVYPEAVVTDPDTNLKSVRYGNLVGPLIEAIKALYDRITGHDARISALETENAALKAKVETSERNYEDLKTRLERLEQR